MKKLLVPIAALASLLLPARADAFCGFYVAPTDEPLYNDATMVALMREGTRMVISMSNNYKGPAADFAMVVPVPVVLQKENVKTLPHDLFKKLEALSAPRLVEYWEQDPCGGYGGEEEKSMSMPPMSAPAAAGAAGKADDYKVKIEAQFKVGEYDVVVLSAEESDGLERWLHDNKYKVPTGASSALAPYVKEQWKFFVARVDVKKVQMDAQGVATLSPLRFHYESQDFRLPVRLGLLNSPQGAKGAAAKQDLIVFVLGRGTRYEVANYTNAFIPTNLDVVDETRKKFGPFYATLFDATMAKAGGRAVVTEYAWETSSCDPCPTPPLEGSDVVTLGGDVLYPSGGEEVGVYGASGIVLTRLHTRYDATTLTEDLVFRKAQPVVGGRELLVDDNGAIEKGARPDSYNNFQARYAIRHEWQGPITCTKPRRGVWGGPPHGGAPGTVPATNLAAAPRGEVKIASLVRKGLDDPDSWDRAAESWGGGPAAIAPRRACGCALPGAEAKWGLTALSIAIVAAASLGRRRAGRRNDHHGERNDR